MQYKVVWEIELDADTPVDAAQQAMDIQRDPASIATCFIIMDKQGNRHDVDLAEDKPPDRM